MEQVLTTMINKLWWPLVSIIGGAMLSRLWVGYVFRREYERHKDNIGKLQEVYNTLVWDNTYGDDFPPQRLEINTLCDFCWEEMQIPIKLCLYTFKVEDRDALRAFMKIGKEFTDMSDFSTKPLSEMYEYYNRYISDHIFCLDLMNNIGNKGTNNGRSITGKVPEFTDFCFDERSIRRKYKKMINNRKNVEDIPELMDILRGGHT